MEIVTVEAGFLRWASQGHVAGVGMANKLVLGRRIKSVVINWGYTSGIRKTTRGRYHSPSTA